MAWTNQKLQLFHGTHQIAADQIKAEGRFALERTRLSNDFGQGIYTTTNFNQVEVWAEKAATRASHANGNYVKPRILVAEMDRNKLSQRSILFFIRYSPDFIDLIEHCRAGNIHSPSNNKYDVIAGPLSRHPRRGVFRGKDQISFHTQKACELLFDSINWEI